MSDKNCKLIDLFGFWERKLRSELQILVLIRQMYRAIHLRCMSRDYTVNAICKFISTLVEVIKELDILCTYYFVYIYVHIIFYIFMHSANVCTFQFSTNAQTHAVCQNTYYIYFKMYTSFIYYYNIFKKKRLK